MAETVTICEVGPRDGLQIAKGRMPTSVKQRWVAAMAGSGLPQIEVGSFVSPKLIPQMADTGEIVRAARALAIPGFTVVALAPTFRSAQTQTQRPRKAARRAATTFGNPLHTKVHVRYNALRLPPSAKCCEKIPGPQNRCDRRARSPHFTTARRFNGT